MQPMQNLNYLIVDGDVSGRIKCSFDESRFIAYRISKKHLSNGVDDFDIRNWTGKSGIYLLFSKGSADKPPVYIGQADQRKNGEGFKARLGEHLKDAKRGDWYEAILLTVNDDKPIPLNALEHKFWEDADKNKRCTLSQTEPHDGKITDEMRGFFDSFVKYGEFFVGILGHKIFVPMTTTTVDRVATTSSGQAVAINRVDSEVFKYDAKKTLAYGKRTDEGFVVLKGAKIASTRKRTKDELKEQTKRLYDKIDADRAEKAYAIDETTWTTTEDLLFASAHEAGGFVSYGLSNHINDWLIETKAGTKSLKQIQQEEAEALAEN